MQMLPRQQLQPPDAAVNHPDIPTARLDRQTVGGRRTEDRGQRTEDGGSAGVLQDFIRKPQKTMSARQVKEYLSHHHVSRLLESLLTGLLYHRPDDPVSFLQRCLIRTGRLGGPETVTWDTFIHLERDQLSSEPLIKPQITASPPVVPQLPPLTPQIPGTSPPPPQLPSIKLKTSILSPMTPPVSNTFPHTTPSAPPQTAPERRVLPPRPRPSAAPPPPAGAPPAGAPPAPSRAPPAGVPPAGAPPGPARAPPGPAGAPPAGALPPGPPPGPPPSSRPAPRPGPGPGPCPGPRPGPPVVHSQLSIDSDSDMTESSGLQQEVSILPPQRPRPLIIFVIGGPGSGKGSQTARLTQHFGLQSVSLDELLRRQLLSHASPSRKWEVISEMMSHGELGPQEDTISELRQQMIGQPEVRGFVVDGFPRDVHQALSFQEQVGSPDLVMLLLCSNERLSCRLQRRAARLGLLGDSSHALRRRLDMFKRDIVSISRYYRQLHLLTQVDADGDEEAVFADLRSVVREKLSLKDQSAPADC